jgi:hypothetical protein
MKTRSAKGIAMNLRRALFIAAFLWPAAAGTAVAQFQPAPQQQPPPCIKEFLRLRNDTEDKGKAIQAASKRKASPREACKLFNIFTAAETKLIKYAADNSVWCGIPPQIVQQMKQGHAKAMEIRTKVCRAAEAPPAPAGPSLSDALTPRVPDADNIKTGRGTFDTLTGTPLGAK